MNVTGDNGQDTNQTNKTNNIGEKGEKKLMDVNKKTSIFDHAPLAAPEDDSDNNDDDDDDNNGDDDDDDLNEAHYTQIKDVPYNSSGGGRGVGSSGGVILGGSSSGIHIGGGMHRDRGHIGDNEMHLMTFSHDSTPNKTKLKHRLRDKGQQSMIIFLSLAFIFCLFHTRN